MALITCKNCGHQISDKAYCCPKCGSQVQATMQHCGNTLPPQQQHQRQRSQFLTPPHQSTFEKKPEKSGNGIYYVIGGIVFILLIAIIGIVVLNKEDSQPQLSAENYAYVNESVENSCDSTSIQSGNTTDNSERDYTSPNLEDITGTYRGKVGKHNIKMTLNFYDGRIDGNYTYTKYGNTLFLSGYLSGNTISLSEETAKGNNSANWTLQQTTTGLTGTMYVYHTGKTHTVNLNRVN